MNDAYSKEAQALLDANAGAADPTAADFARNLARLESSLGWTPPSGGGAVVGGTMLKSIAVITIGGAAIGGFFALRDAPGQGVHDASDTPVVAGVVGPNEPERSIVSSAPAPAPALSSPSAELAPPIETSRRMPGRVGRDLPAEPVVALAPEEAPQVEPAPNDDSLEREFVLISSAQRLLDSGDPAAALRLFEQHRRDFAGGSLRQEATAGVIIARCLLGEDDWTLRAEFMSEWPRSPSAARIQRTCGDGD